MFCQKCGTKVQSKGGVNKTADDISRTMEWLSSNARTQFLYKGKAISPMRKMHRSTDWQYSGLRHVLYIRSAARVLRYRLCGDVH